MSDTPKVAGLQLASMLASMGLLFGAIAVPEGHIPALFALLLPAVIFMVTPNIEV